MRVEILEQMAPREEPPAEALADVSVKLALQNFTNALRGDDSLFAEQGGITGPGAAVGGGPLGCAGEFVLKFRDEKLGRSRDLHFQLIQKLTELLKAAGSPDVLTAKLCLAAQEQQDSKRGMLALRIRLEASGDSAEKAALRWGLGLAQIQQALLFTSRHLKQQISPNGS